jgi:hypothetical protein
MSPIFTVEEETLITQYQAFKLTSQQATSVEGGATIPVAPASFSPAFGGGRSATNTQELRYSLWPLPDGLQDPGIVQHRPGLTEIKGAPIAYALLNLRNQQIFSAMKIDPSTGIPNRGPQPCFTNFDWQKPADAPGNQYVLAIGREVTAGGGIKVNLAVLQIGASGERSSSTGNKLTVRFRQTGLQEAAANTTATQRAAAPPATAQRPRPPVASAGNQLPNDLGVLRNRLRAICDSGDSAEECSKKVENLLDARVGFLSRPFDLQNLNLGNDFMNMDNRRRRLEEQR